MISSFNNSDVLVHKNKRVKWLQNGPIECWPKYRINIKCQMSSMWDARKTRIQLWWVGIVVVDKKNCDVPKRYFMISLSFALFAVIRTFFIFLQLINLQVSLVASECSALFRTKQIWWNIWTSNATNSPQTHFLDIFVSLKHSRISSIACSFPDLFEWELAHKL